MSRAWKSLGAVCVLVIGMYAYTAPLGKLESLISNPADAYYNLLVQGFREGHPSVKKEVPTGFARLADPYDPIANAVYRAAPYRLHDLSYYKGRLFLCWGVTPALMLFWPFVALTGRYLLDRQAVTIFCAMGFLVSVGLLLELWRRYFSEVSAWVVAACALALGLATGVPMLLGRCKAYEVAISSGYMLAMVALSAIWCALHETKSRKRSGWLMAASVAYGLAIGARPSLLFGAVILLVPVVEAWRGRQKIWALLLAATGPLLLIVLALMLYNAQRFDSPFEFGWRYQLNPEHQLTQQLFSPRFLWFNFRVYFLEPVRWSRDSPFVRNIAAPPLPAGHCSVDVDEAFGVLTNTPLVWLALAVPLAWRGRSGQESSILRWYVAAVLLFIGACVVTLGSFFSAAMRYEVDFLPALMVLAVIGILGLERALADRPVQRRAVRCGWGLLFGFSLAFNLLVGVKNYAYAECSVGTMLALKGRVPEAIRVFENALRIKPDYAEAHKNLGIALAQTGKIQEAIAHYEQALRIKPDLAAAHCVLGIALAHTGKIEEAIAHYEQALRIEPDLVDAHNNLGIALAQTGKIEEAIAHFDQALRINPDDAEAHYNLGIALGQAGRVQEAMEQWEQALRIKPDEIDTHYNLGLALEKLGRSTEAIEHYRQALKLRPDFAPARNALTRLQAGQ
jgi:tetratricopeptide (TPR) repeat protein